jgi:DNA-3-methyladenine glycosylase I
MPASKVRCAWAESSDAMRSYHDLEWGVPLYDDRHLFELLTLEGAQAGLSWSTVLNKRDGYSKAFDDFDITRVSKYTPAKIEKLLQNPDIIRNRLKVESTVSNARAFIAVQKEFGAFADYLWAFTDNKQIVNHRKAGEPLPPSDALSDRVSKDMKKRGFRFVGTTIIYSYLQASGVIDDHDEKCAFKHK